MISYRCTACTRDHATAQQPAACAGCGNASFSAIVLDDFGGLVQAQQQAEVVERSPGMPDELESELAAVWASRPATPADDAPPTPRDMPEVPAFDQAAHAARQQLAEQGEEVAVAALQPDPDKEPHLCSQRGCFEPATHRFTWPGHAEARACYPHAQKAAATAEAMGFFLEVPAL